MASQGERVLGVVGMCSCLESMVQDKIPEQDTPEQYINVQEQFFPQLNPEPERGAAVAAESDTPLPTSVKILPQPPAKPRPTEAIRLRRMRLKSCDWRKG